MDIPQASADAFAQGLDYLEQHPEATWVDLVDNGVMSASALLSPERVLSFPVDSTRIDLVDEFREAPLGPHGADLHVLLWALRSQTPGGRYAIQIQSGGGWAVVRLNGSPRPWLEPVLEVDSREDAEWAAFALRWNDQTGQQLSLAREDA